MPNVSFKDKSGDLIESKVFPDSVRIVDLYNHVMDYIPLVRTLPNPMQFILGLWDPHHKTFYPLNEHSGKPVVQFIHKGGSQEISVYILPQDAVRDTTLGVLE